MIRQCCVGGVAVGVAYSAVAGDMASLAVAEAASLAGSGARWHRGCGIHAGLLKNVPVYATMCYAGIVTVGVAYSAVAGDMASLAVAEAASLTYVEGDATAGVASMRTI